MSRHVGSREQDQLSITWGGQEWLVRREQGLGEGVGLTRRRTKSTALWRGRATGESEEGPVGWCFALSRVQGVRTGMEDGTGEVGGMRFLDNGESPKGQKLEETGPTCQ